MMKIMMRMIARMRWKLPLLCLLLVAIGIAAGFFWGKQVSAGGTGPGSSADPLVARSYVDAQVATYIAGLEQRVSELTARESQLEQALAQLQKQQGIAPIQPSAPAAPKQVYIKTDNNAVNLRQGPGVNYPVIATLNRGSASCEPMTVLSQSGDWYQVRLPDARTGWVADWLVESR
jgi:hypothetical protein